MSPLICIPHMLMILTMSILWVYVYSMHKCGTNLRLNKPPFLPATSIAGLEMIGRVDSDTMVGVIQGGKVEPGGAKMKCSDLECQKCCNGKVYV